MAWKIKIDPKAEKDLSKLDRQIARRITQFLSQRVAILEASAMPCKGQPLATFGSAESEITASSATSKMNS